MDEISPVSNSQLIKLFFVESVIGNRTTNLLFTNIALQAVQFTPNNAACFGIVSLQRLADATA